MNSGWFAETRSALYKGHQKHGFPVDTRPPSQSHFLNNNLQIIKKTCDDSSINFIKEMLDLCDAEKNRKRNSAKI